MVFEEENKEMIPSGYFQRVLFASTSKPFSDKGLDFKDTHVATNVFLESKGKECMFATLFYTFLSQTV